MVEMPTGIGKTIVSITGIIFNTVDNGGRVEYYFNNIKLNKQISD